jgi:cephalosporin hydroxylase
MVRDIAGPCKQVMVILDSNHTHDHVLSELHAYGDLVTVGSYCVVLDTIVEELPSGFFKDRPWDKGNSPKTAVAAFLAEQKTFEVDVEFEAKLMISAAPGGFLKRVR